MLDLARAAVEGPHDLDRQCYRRGLHYPRICPAGTLKRVFTVEGVVGAPTWLPAGAHSAFLCRPPLLQDLRAPHGGRAAPTVAMMGAASFVFSIALAAISAASPSRLASQDWRPDSIPSRPWKSWRPAATWLLEWTTASDGARWKNLFALAVPTAAPMRVSRCSVPPEMSSRRSCRAFFSPRRYAANFSGDSSSTRSSSSTSIASCSWKQRARTASHFGTSDSACLAVLARPPTLVLSNFSAITLICLNA